MRRRYAFLLLGVVASSIAATPTPVLSGETLEEAVEAFWAAEDERDRDTARQAVLDLDPAPGELEGLLKRGREYAEGVPTGWIIGRNEACDGVERPYHFYSPPAYDPAKRYPLVFNLHGGVSRPSVISAERFSRYREQMWGEAARDAGVLLALPLGQKGAEWWSENGLDNLLGILSRIKRVYNVDENRVFVTGFSDGGSGSFFLALNRSTPFAGFLPLNGFPPVAGVQGFPVYLTNAANKPMYVVNTTEDALYPAKLVTPFIEGMKEAGAEITYKVYENIGHRPDYWPKERAPILAFLRKTGRDPLPRTLSWETSRPGLFGRCHWVRIDEVAETGNDAPELVKDINPLVKDDRVRLGIYMDREFPGPGVRVERLSGEDTTAGRMGIEKGDVITGMDGEAVGDLSDLRRILSEKKPGDGVRIVVLRGEAARTLEGRFADPAPRPVLARDETAGRIAVRADGNRVEVRTRNVARYTLFVSRDLFDVRKPLTVTTNGRASFEGFVAPDAAFMLERASADEDRTMVFWGKIEIDARKAAGEEEGRGF